MDDLLRGPSETQQAVGEMEDGPLLLQDDGLDDEEIEFGQRACLNGQQQRFRLRVWRGHRSKSDRSERGEPGTSHFA